MLLQNITRGGGDVVERLHPQVSRDGGALVVSGIDMKTRQTRYALLCAIAGDERKALRMVPDRQDYRSGRIIFTPSDAAIGDALAILLCRELRRAGGEI